MNITATPIEGLLVLEPNILKDDRGYFFESYNVQTLQSKANFSTAFVQDNQARSSKNVLRGLHYQNEPHAQTKLVRALEGAIWDVVVDIRPDSKNIRAMVWHRTISREQKTVIDTKRFCTRLFCAHRHCRGIL